MCIHSYGIMLIFRKENICCLSSNSGKSNKQIKITRHISIEFIHKIFRAVNYVLGLISIKVNRLDNFKDIFYIGISKLFNSSIFSEKLFAYLDSYLISSSGG